MLTMLSALTLPTMLPKTMLPVLTMTSAPPAAFSTDLVLVLLSIAGVMCVLGLVFFTTGRVRTTMCKNWVPSTGLIVNRKGTTDGWMDRYPTFGWTGPDGRVYRKTSMVHGGFYRLGSEVPILVDPQQPQRAIINTFIQKGVIFTVIGSMMGGFGLLIIAVAGYFALTS